MAGHEYCLGSLADHAFCVRMRSMQWENVVMQSRPC
jgi:hypothetical protein